MWHDMTKLEFVSMTKIHVTLTRRIFGTGIEFYLESANVANLWMQNNQSI